MQPSWERRGGPRPEAHDVSVAVMGGRQHLAYYAWPMGQSKTKHELVVLRLWFCVGPVRGRRLLTGTCYFTVTQELLVAHLALTDSLPEVMFHLLCLTFWFLVAREGLGFHIQGETGPDNASGDAGDLGGSGVQSVLLVFDVRGFVPSYPADVG